MQPVDLGLSDLRMMFARHGAISASRLLAITSLFAVPAFAQLMPMGLPSPQAIANADKFNPPRLAQYAARLAHLPDMTGTWTAMLPKGASNGPTFEGIPYNAEYQKKYRQLIKETTGGKSRDTIPTCVPYGVPRMIGDSPSPFDIIQTPDVMIWYDNYSRTERRIFLDGRTHPLQDGPRTGGNGPRYSGFSVGHREGNTLVIDTTNMVPAYFDETPAPYSDQLHMVERVRLIAPNILQDQATFTDPVTMTKPWIVTRYFRRNVGKREYLELNDRLCVPNVRTATEAPAGHTGSGASSRPPRSATRPND
jgi:hypothetical protein